jgi:hypothetical protein
LLLRVHGRRSDSLLLTVKSPVLCDNTGFLLCTDIPKP